MKNIKDPQSIASMIASHSDWSEEDLIQQTLEWHRATREASYFEQQQSIP